MASVHDIRAVRCGNIRRSEDLLARAICESGRSEGSTPGTHTRALDAGSVPHGDRNAAEHCMDVARCVRVPADCIRHRARHGAASDETYRKRHVIGQFSIIITQLCVVSAMSYPRARRPENLLRSRLLFCTLTAAISLTLVSSPVLAQAPHITPAVDPSVN